MSRKEGSSQDGEDKRSKSKSRKAPENDDAVDDLLSSIVKSSAHRSLFLVSDDYAGKDKKYKLVAEVYPSIDDMKAIMPHVKRGAIESLRSEEKLARDSGSPKKRAKSKKSRAEESDATFPLHHYTKDIIKGGEFDNSFEEWIFDPIISSNYEHRELMAKTRKEKAIKEAKQKKMDDKIKKVKPSDTFYLLNKKRLNLEPALLKPTSVVNFQPSKPKTKMKSVSTNTDLLIIEDQVTEPKNAAIPDSSQKIEITVDETSPVIDSPPKMNYLEGMDDTESKGTSPPPTEKRIEMPKLHITDTVDLFKDYNMLSSEVNLNKKVTSTITVRGEVIDRDTSGAAIPPPPARIKPSKPESVAKIPSLEPKVETPRQEEPDKKPSSDNKKALAKPGITSKNTEENTTSKIEKQDTDTDSKVFENKNSQKESEAPTQQKKETENPKEVTPPPAQKPAPTMGRIPLPPVKKPATVKDEDQVKHETPVKHAPTIQKADPVTVQTKPDEEKKPEEQNKVEADIPKFSNNPFLARQASAKTPASPTKPANPLLNKSPEKNEPAKKAIANSTIQMPPKSDQAEPTKSPLNEESDKISGLRSIWK